MNTGKSVRERCQRGVRQGSVEESKDTNVLLGREGFLFKILLFFFMCKSALLHACAPCVMQCLQRTEKGAGSRRTGVALAVSHYVGAGNQSQALRKSSQCS